MIRIKVKAIMKLAKILGGREQYVDLKEGSCIIDLLNYLEIKYEKPFAEIVFIEGKKELRNDISILLNGRNIIFMDGVNTVFKDGDEIFFLTRVGGG